ncbi:MAG TPA: hypothetical protein DDY13_08290 [Cytophagales bacterium]|jgi:competence protein ComEC|nr:hypothetical protein [Cytophagales bacterium]
MRSLSFFFPPMLKAFLAVLSGIFCASLWMLNGLICAAVIVLAVISAIYLLHIQLKKSGYTSHVIAAISLFWVYFSIGFFTFFFHERLSKNEFSFKKEKNITSFFAVISSIPKQTGNYIQFEAHTYYDIENTDNTGDYTILVNVIHDLLTANSLIPGRLLFIKSEPYEVRSKKNPFVFDYYDYLKKTGIDAIDYIRHENEIIDTGLMERNGSFKLLNLKQGLVNNIEVWLKNERSAALIQSLLLGYKANLSEDVKKQFKELGIAHILAVSGLHIGIVYLIYHLLFSFLIRYRFGKAAYLILGIVFIVAFVLLAGAPVSAIRASIMLVLFLIARTFSKQYNGFNILGFAAILMVLIDPASPWDVGFQLSFLAVYGILLFFKPFMKPFENAPKILKYLSASFCITLSVQLTTAPVLLYHFGAVSLSGFLANFYAVPFAFIFIFGGFILLLSALFTPLLTIVSFILNAIINLFFSINDFVNQVSQITYIDLILPGHYLWAFLLLVIIFGLWWQTRSVMLVKSLLLLCIFVLLLNIAEEYLVKQKPTLYAFNGKDPFLIFQNESVAFHYSKNGRSSDYLLNSINNSSRRPFNKPRLIDKTIKLPGSTLIVFHGRKILVIEEASQFMKYLVNFAGQNEIWFDIVISYDHSEELLNIWGRQFDCEKLILRESVGLDPSSKGLFILENQGAYIESF